MLLTELLLQGCWRPKHQGVAASPDLLVTCSRSSAALSATGTIIHHPGICLSYMMQAAMHAAHIINVYAAAAAVSGWQARTRCHPPCRTRWRSPTVPKVVALSSCNSNERNQDD
jgi:hypothetical protein